ncbi:MAG: sulfatase-like hydrolase/transferase [Candidatus Zixiibacteriota bacterium]
MFHLVGKFFFVVSERYIPFYRYLLTALALNIPIMLLVLFLNVRYIDKTFVTCLYFLSLVRGYYVLPLLMAVSLISLLFFPLKRLVTALSLAVTSIFVYYLLVDSLTFRIAKIHIDYFWLEWIFNDYRGLGLPSSTIPLALAGLAGVVLIETGIFTLAKKIKIPKFIILAFPACTVLMFAVSQVMHIVAYEKNDSRVTNITPYLPFYMPITSHANADRYGEVLPLGEHEDDLRASANRYGTLNYPMRPLEFQNETGTKPPNIVMILLESWRFDAMNEQITPRIYELSKKSSVFLDHFSCGNQTTLGVFGLFYGLHATYWNAVKANNELIDNPVLIDELKRRGYDFGIYARSNFERHKIKDAVFRGIDVFENFAGNDIMLHDVEMTERAATFVRNRVKNNIPFFSFLFYKSNHMPYRYPESRELFKPAAELNMVFTDRDTDPTPFLNDYCNATHYVDSLIGRLLDELNSLGVMDNTIIIVTTDHGEQFNDNRENYWGHGSNFTIFQTKVPFVLYLPGREPREITYRTSHNDLPPTLLSDWFGATTPAEYYCNGRRLFDPAPVMRPLVLGSYVNYAYIFGDDVYEIFPMYTKKYKLYDIKREASQPDPVLLKQTIEEISRFYRGNCTSRDDNKDRWM